VLHRGPGGAAGALPAGNPDRPGLTDRALGALRALEPEDALHPDLAGQALHPLQTLLALLTGGSDDPARALTAGQSGLAPHAQLTARTRFTARPDRSDRAYRALLSRPAR